MASCNYCGEFVSPRAKFCPHCGEEEPGSIAKAISNFFSQLIGIIILIWIAISFFGH